MSPALFANPKAHVQDSQACLLGHTRAQLPAQGHGHPSPPAGSPAELGHSPRTMLSCRPPSPGLPPEAGAGFVTRLSPNRPLRGQGEASLLLTHPGLPLFSADTRRVPGASARTLHMGRGLSGAVVAQSGPQTPKHFSSSSSSSQGVFREPILMLPCYCHPPADFAAQTSPNIKSSLFDAPIARPIGFLMLRRAQIVWGGKGVLYFSQKS